MGFQWAELDATHAITNGWKGDPCELDILENYIFIYYWTNAGTNNITKHNCVYLWKT